MKIADAHCDTLTAFNKDVFNSEKAHWNLNKFREVGGELQYFALFTEPELTGDAALSFAFRHIGKFIRTMPSDVVLLKSRNDFEDDKVNILLSLEGATPIVNTIDNLYSFYELGVRAMTLTWNHRNFLADGIDEPYGLTQFGKEVVKEMEKLKMIIDVSHLNTAGFDDVLNTVDCPIIASHSNSRAVFDHPRNLYDEQIKEIIKRKGFIGINLYSQFLGNKNDDLKKKMINHIEHILALGGEDVLGFGADFDGIDECPFSDVRAYLEIKQLFDDIFGEGNPIIDKFLHKNLTEFTLNYL